MASNGSLSMFNRAVASAAMVDALEQPGITVLAPSDQAMSAVPDIDTIIGDPGLAGQLVSAHVISGAADAATIFGQSSIGQYSVDGLAMTITGPNATASITEPDQHATNGWVHTISAVLSAPVVPPTEPPATG